MREGGLTKNVSFKATGPGKANTDEFGPLNCDHGKGRGQNTIAWQKKMSRVDGMTTMRGSEGRGTKLASTLTHPWSPRRKNAPNCMRIIYRADAVMADLDKPFVHELDTPQARDFKKLDPWLDEQVERDLGHE